MFIKLDLAQSSLGTIDITQTVPDNNSNDAEGTFIANVTVNARVIFENAMVGVALDESIQFNYEFFGDYTDEYNNLAHTTFAIPDSGGLPGIAESFLTDWPPYDS